MDTVNTTNHMNMYIRGIEEKAEGTDIYREFLQYLRDIHISGGEKLKCFRTVTDGHEGIMAFSGSNIIIFEIEGKYTAGEHGFAGSRFIHVFPRCFSDVVIAEEAGDFGRLLIAYYLTFEYDARTRHDNGGIKIYCSAKDDDIVSYLTSVALS